MSHWMAEFLRHIPQSNQDAQTLHQLMPSATPEQQAQGRGMLLLLQAFGMVHYVPELDSVQASSQTAKYALLSLADYVEHNTPIVADWKQRGIYPNGLPDALQNGASFLHLLEARRLALNPHAKPTRLQKVSQVLIKRRNPHTGEDELLFQYDGNARRYQLIGGRMSERDHDDPLETLVREIEEELPDSPLHYPHDYQLVPLIHAYSPPPSLSSTFGAHTQYTFWVYHLQGLRVPLSLGETDRWIPLSQVLSADFEASDATTAPRLFQQFERIIVGGMANLGSSWLD